MDGSSSTLSVVPSAAPSVTSTTAPAPVVAQVPVVSQPKTFKPTPVTAPVSVQQRTFQPTPVAAPISVQPKTFQSTPIAASVPAPAPVSVQTRTVPITAAPSVAKPSLNKNKLTKDITEKLQSMLGLIDEEIDVTIPLRVYGLDSLTAMELTKWIESEMNIEFSQSQLLGDDITTEDLINIIMDGSSSIPTTAPDSAAPATTPGATPAPVRTFQPTPVTAPVTIQSSQVKSLKTTSIAAPAPQKAFQPAQVARVASSTVKPSLNKDKLTKDITEKLQSMLGLIDEEIDVTIPLRVYGLDSLTAMELTKWIESEMNIEFSQSQLLGDDITTEDLINIIMDGSSSTPSSAPSAIPTTTPAPVVAPVVVSSVQVPNASNFHSAKQTDPQPNIENIYQDIPTIQSISPKTNNNVDNEALKNEICSRLQNMLGLVDEEIDPAIPLRVYGLDSLTAMELTNWIQDEFKVTLPQSQLLTDEITTNELVNIVANLLSNNDGSYYNNSHMDFNDSKPVSSIADSESTFDASIANQYDVQINETIMTDDLLKSGTNISGNKQEVIKALKGEVVAKLQDLLGLVDEEIDTNVPLQVYGLDSLTSMEIVKWIENDKNVELPQSALLSSEITTEELVDMIATKITGEVSVKGPSYDQYMDNGLLI